MFGFALVSFCTAEMTIDLQVPGGDRWYSSFYEGFQFILALSFGVPQFLLHESSVFLVLQDHLAAAGNPSKFSCKWCHDSEANCHIAADITEFKYNYRATSINLSVAKQNICTQAIGNGDCLVH